VNGFDIPKSPEARQVDVRCFTYSRKPQSRSTAHQSGSDEEVLSTERAARVNVREADKSSVDEDEETPKCVHLIGSGKYRDDEVEYCTTASSAEEAC
jgi:hypothetical protein